MAREREDWIAFASSELVLDLLPVLDHFELGLADSARNGAPAAFTEGFQLIYNQFRAVLEKAGVQAIGPKASLRSQPARSHQPHALGHRSRRARRHPDPARVQNGRQTHQRRRGRRLFRPRRGMSGARPRAPNAIVMMSSACAHRLREPDQKGLSQTGDEIPPGPQSGRQGGRGEIRGGHRELRNPLQRRPAPSATASSAGTPSDAAAAGRIRRRRPH